MVQVGSVSDVKPFSDRLELFHVADYSSPQTIPFADVQKEIEEQLLNLKREQARDAVREELRQAGNVVMAGQTLSGSSGSAGPF